MLNLAVLMGRLVANPELRHTPSNIAVTSFTIAVERGFVKAGGEKQTDFIDIVAWRNTAEFVTKYFSKGQLVAIEGSIQTRTYTDKDGNKRKAFEVLANAVHFAEPKRDSGSGGSQVPRFDDIPATTYAAGTNDDFKEIEEDDDLPF